MYCIPLVYENKTYIYIYNSCLGCHTNGCCLSIDSVNVNKS